jgi:hypothetical protein
MLKLKQSVVLAIHLRQGLGINHENPVITVIRNTHIPIAGQKRAAWAKVPGYLQEDEK